MYKNEELLIRLMNESELPRHKLGMQMEDRIRKVRYYSCVLNIKA
ncbi:hypothetical protein [Bacillus atrophaeus]|nr:hypothetical protein [Bacillus atrophaeus]ARW06929.1 hypothetical protein S101359_01922 [Bacillus atrophaeus]